MSEVEWIKLSTDMFNSRKIKQIEQMPEGDTILVIWFKLLTLAGSINDGGAIYLTPEIPYDEETLAWELKRDIKVVRLSLAVFEKFGMIEYINGFIYLSSWEKYQNIEGLDRIREQNKLRKRKQREAQKALSPPMSRDCHVTVTQCHDTEEEGEEDKDKELHSFTHTRARACEDEAVENYESLKQKYIGGSLGGGVVLMNEEQFADLCERLSLDELNKYLGIVRDCELSGQRYTKRTHYQAILDMAEKDRRVRR